MNNTVLVIDDDEELCSLLSDYLTLEGFNLSSIHDGAEAVEHCQNTHYDAIILDIMLPSIQGLDVLRALREFTTTPVIMLTAKGADTDRIVGLEMGADDYLPKPCNPRELAARLRAVLRRAQPKDNSNNLHAGNLYIDTRQRGAHYKEQLLELTGAEFNVLALLVRHHGEIVTKEVLSKEALGRPLTAYDRSIDVHISKLRKKLSNTSIQITNIRGAGYQLISSEGNV